jgi:hypothetical protein
MAFARFAGGRHTLRRGWREGYSKPDVFFLVFIDVDMITR